jgi:hypothetical protein
LEAEFPGNVFQPKADEIRSTIHNIKMAERSENIAEIELVQ